MNQDVSKSVPVQKSADIPLSVQGVSKYYGEFKALDKVEFNLEKGEIFGLLGPNGAGKTTLISAIVDLEKASSGDIFVFGEKVGRGLQTKRDIGFVPQEVINHGYFNVEEILTFHSGFYGIRNNKKRIEELLQRLALWEHKNKKVKQLSGGMKRRLMIAKALVHTPKLFLLDEPTAGVDIELRNSLWEFVVELKNQGTTVLLTTHYLEEAQELCDRVGILRNGVLEKMGHTKDLIDELSNRKLVIDLNGKAPSGFSHPCLEKQEKLEGVDGDRLVFKLPKGTEMGSIINSLGFSLDSIKDIQTEEGTLEEVFLSVLNS